MHWAIQPPLLLLSAAAVAGQGDEAVAARLTPAVRACETAPDNGDTIQHAICYRDEFERQNERLNAEWHRIMTDLPPARRATLRRQERMWIRERESDCRYGATDYINSTAAYSLIATQGISALAPSLFTVLAFGAWNDRKPPSPAAPAYLPASVVTAA